jgi:hypothetical protein
MYVRRTVPFSPFFVEWYPAMTQTRGNPWALLAIFIFVMGCGVQTSVAPPEPIPESPRRDTSARDHKLLQHHNTCVELFSKTAGNGIQRLVIPRHQPTHYPLSVVLSETVHPNGSQANAPERPWGMVRHELIGLMDPSDVGAYSTNPLDHASKGPGKRALDRFENRALAQLRAGAELVIEEVADGHLRAVGAIRLKTECLGCHLNIPRHEEETSPAMQVGHLLGAFHYEFRRGVEVPGQPVHPFGESIVPPNPLNPHPEP